MSQLAGLTTWILTPPRQGNRVLCRGLAQALGLHPIEFTIKPKWPWKALAPRGPVDPRYKVTHPLSPFIGPKPDIIFASGRQAIPALTHLRQVAEKPVFTMILQNPKVSLNAADLFWVPEHDGLKGENVISTLTSPHTITFEDLQTLRANTSQDIAQLEGLTIGLFLGGSNQVFSYSSKVIARLAIQLETLKQAGFSFLVTNSRRTDEALLRQVQIALNGAPVIYSLWGDSINRYQEFLANADHLIVTADSTNMVSEMAVTGKPIHIFYPSPPKGKFAYFLNAMEGAGYAKALDVRPNKPLTTWIYEPINATDTIAKQVEHHWLIYRSSTNL